MTTNRPLFYVLLIAAFTVLIIAVALVGYNLLSLAFGQPPTPTPIATAAPGATLTATASITAVPSTTALPATVTPTASPLPGTPDVPAVTVVADLLNVRSGPGLTFDIIATVPAGTAFRAEGRTEDGLWLLICCVGEQWGWVANTAETVSINFNLLNRPVVTFNHIPLVSPGFSFQEFDEDPFYGPSLLTVDGHLRHRHVVSDFDALRQAIGTHPFPLALAGHYHAAQSGTFEQSGTQFRQTSALTRPDRFTFHGFEIRSGFTVYEVDHARIVGSKFVPLNLPDPKS